MRMIPDLLAGRLSGETTTLARCWRATRRDGAVFGFTDHDRDLAFDGTVFTAASGLEAAEAARREGLSVGGGEVAGALSGAAIAEADLAAGLWDGARVETFLVDWSEPAARMRLSVDTIGEVRREGGAFTAELRGPAHKLDVTLGRLFAAPCDAELGDRRCGVDLSAAQWWDDATVLAAPGPQECTVSLPEAREDGWFAGGVALVAGTPCAIRAHRSEPDAARLLLWDAPAAPLVPGLALRLRAGCDKRFETCRDRFANAKNFRGFPHIPGADRALGYPQAGDPPADGGSYFR